MQISTSITSSSVFKGAQVLPAQPKDQRVQNGASKATTAATTDPKLQSEIQALKDRDREVRIHEQAHLSAAGGIAVSGAQFSFTTGPDGQRYAIGGEVNIDTSPVSGDPEATLRKADAIRRAALAPAQPSSQDFSVASSAASMANNARIELLRQQQNTQESGTRLNVVA